MLPNAHELDLSRAVAQLVVPTLFGGPLKGRPYDARAIADDLERHGWGGYILFHGAETETRERVAALQACSTLPLLIASDLEHGAGQQIQGLSTFPPAMAFGAAGDPEQTRELGRHTAAEALSVGINWVFAPVADVTNNPLNPIINIRSFGGDPESVARHVAAFVAGCQDAGALACAKHFPGHGDTETDSHSRLGVIDAPRDRLEAVEWTPFRAAIASGVRSIMTAHLAVPSLGTGMVPATLSASVMTDVVRQELGFEGLVVTDALVMGGITREADPADAAVRALKAGCDVLLMPLNPVETLEAVLAAVRSGALAERRVREACARVLAAKAWLAARTSAHTDAEAARALANVVAARAISRVGTIRPLKRGDVAIALDDGVEPDRLEAWHAGVRERGLEGGPALAVDAPVAAWIARAEAAPADRPIGVGVFSPIRIHKDRSLLPESALAGLAAVAARRPIVLISFSSPFLAAQVPEAEGWLLAYGSRPFQIAAALDAAMGLAEAGGRLPVELPVVLTAATGRTLEGGSPSFA